MANIVAGEKAREDLIFFYFYATSNYYCSDVLRGSTNIHTN